jgi:hypothetical protein
MLPFTLVAPPGFEPRQTVPKTVVLPLYYRAPYNWMAKLVNFPNPQKKLSKNRNNVQNAKLLFCVNCQHS